MMCLIKINQRREFMSNKFKNYYKNIKFKDN